MEKVNLNNNKSRLMKIGNKYFLPFETWDYIDLGSMFFFLGLAFMMKTLDSGFSYLLITLVVIFIFRIITAIRDRFFIEIKTSNSLKENINLIKELALRQPNFTESLDEEGLLLFEYPEQNIVYKYNLRKRENTETVVIYCEDNSIWLNSFQQRYVGLFRRSNLKQWIKLIHIKTKGN